ncbi:MAG: TonB-dependent receptor, partial [Rhodothermales bacterium]|nr:TonB-dependent receptor [Rhodothermales bacterium]
ALEEVQVQTGGFNAEYGNVRAGIVNVTTKEPPRNRYTFDGLFRYAPPQDKSFNALGQLPDNCDYSDPGNIDPTCNAYWVRPALDPAVAMEGTSNWDPYTQRQFKAFDGWANVAAQQQEAGFDVTANDLMEYFRFTHRKDNTIDIPDYEADFTFGGPLIPGVSQKLGDLRFLFSYRGSQTAYTLPQTRESYDTDTYQLKLTSNLRRGMRLMLHGMRGVERGVIPDADATQVSVWQGNLPAYPWQWVNSDVVTELSAERGDGVWSDATLGLGNIDHTLLGATFTHTLNASTFYELTLQNLTSKYRHRHPSLRDASFVCPEDGVGPNGQACTPGAFVPVLFTNNGRLTDAGRANMDQVTCFGGGSDLNGDGEVTPFCIGTEPFGFAGTGGNLLTGEGTGGHWNKTRDTTDVNVFSGRIDLTSQLNRFLQVKTGAELIVSDYDVNSQRISLALGFLYGNFRWNRAPIQGAAYAQSKLEFKGMIANIGLRLDYFDANSDWWVFEPFDQALRGEEDALDEQLELEAPEAQAFVSPRIGVSFPITDDSKLYFNYGHFRQMLNPFDIFGVQSTPAGGIDVIGNPEHPMPKTVAYELGFDQNLFDLLLLRVSGFYRDVREQPRGVVFHSLGDVVNYTTFRPWNYEDVRGAEFTVTKNRGRWVRGFLNYTYLQTKSGNFGFAEFFENSFDQLTYLRSSTDYRLNAPLAQPFARMNLMVLTPQGFGPDVAGAKPLSDWRVSLLGEWRAGEKWTWHGGGGTFPELEQNVEWRNYMNFDLRFTKHIGTPFADMQLFLDVDNIFNRKHLYNQAAFAGFDRDFDRYMWSLHLPGDIFDGVNTVTCADAGVDVEDCSFAQKRNLPYVWVPGDDRPGIFRDEDVDYQPINAVQSLDTVTEPDQIAWYYEQTSETFFRHNGTGFEPVPDGEVRQVLDDKAYIDMPNFTFNTFLNPRRYTLGVRVSF